MPSTVVMTTSPGEWQQQGNISITTQLVQAGNNFTDELAVLMQQDEEEAAASPSEDQVTATGIPINLLWVPYVCIVGVLLLLLFISFCSYHRKHNLMVKRRNGSGVERGGRKRGDKDHGEDSCSSSQEGDSDIDRGNRYRGDSEFDSDNAVEEFDDYFELAASAYGGPSSRARARARLHHNHNQRNSRSRHGNSRPCTSFDPSFWNLSSCVGMATSTSVQESLLSHSSPTPHLSDDLSPEVEQRHQQSARRLEHVRESSRRGESSSNKNGKRLKDSDRTVAVFDEPLRVHSKLKSKLNHSLSNDARYQAPAHGEISFATDTTTGSMVNVCMLDMEGVFTSGFPASWDHSCDNLADCDTAGTGAQPSQVTRKDAAVARSNGKIKTCGSGQGRQQNHVTSKGKEPRTSNGSVVTKKGGRATSGGTLTSRGSSAHSGSGAATPFSTVGYSSIDRDERDSVRDYGGKTRKDRRTQHHKPTVAIADIADRYVAANRHTDSSKSSKSNGKVKRGDTMTSSSPITAARSSNSANSNGLLAYDLHDLAIHTLGSPRQQHHHTRTGSGRTTLPVTVL
jgi:hypothetical protein